MPVALRDLLALTKPRLSALVIITCGGSMLLAPGSIDPVRGLVALLASTFIVGAANALNCYLERDLDRAMERTRTRPLAARRLDPRAALVLAAALVALSIPALTIAANPLTAILALIALVSYVAVYTPMKQRSALALWVGGVPGAIPPLMGWTAVRGRIELAGVLLFAVLFFWQIPHFIAVAINRKEDYERAGHRVLPLVLSRRAVKIHALFWSVLLLATTLTLPAVGLVRSGFAIAAGALGIWFVSTAAKGLFTSTGEDDKPWARKLFRDSLMYLTALFAALAIAA